MKTLMVWLFALFALFPTTFAASAADVKTVPTVKQTKLGLYLTSQEAANFMTKNASKTLFLDIRTPSEITFLGMAAPVDANVPYMVEPPFREWDAAKSSFKLEHQSRFSSGGSPQVEREGVGAK